LGVWGLVEMQDGEADWPPWLLLLLLGCMRRASECLQFMLQIYGAASNFKIHQNSGIMAKQTEKGIGGFYTSGCK
jgi:hypothetical protein